MLAASPADARPAQCILEVAGKAHISGSCDYRLLKDASADFQVTGTDGRHFVYIYVDGDRASAHWNGEAAESRAHDPLGELRRDGGCWVNDTARICVSVDTAAGGPPYGRWNCEIMSFILNAESYEVSGAGGRISGIERIGRRCLGCRTYRRLQICPVRCDPGPSDMALPCIRRHLRVHTAMRIAWLRDGPALCRRGYHP